MTDFWGRVDMNATNVVAKPSADAPIRDLLMAAWVRRAISARWACMAAAALMVLAGCNGGSATPAASENASRIERSGDASEETDSVHKAWREELAAFREKRESGLRSPDGWMALVGLHWFEPGRHSLGSGEGSEIRLAVGPATLGQIELLPEAMAARLQLSEGVQVRSDGEAVEAGELILHGDKAETPTRLDFEGGNLGLIERGGRFALRVRSPQAPTLLEFKGLNWFEPDPRFLVEARFEPHAPGKTIPIVNVLGQVEATPNPGRLYFELEGEAYTLEALGDPDDTLFLIFADRSNRRESYGAGRFLYTGKVVDGHVRLDFNRAINPPCAYTEFSTCPLPPPENRLRAFIAAGEARYGHIQGAPTS